MEAAWRRTRGSRFESELTASLYSGAIRRAADEAREFLLKYGREYLALDVNYRAAKFCERKNCWP